MKRSIAVLVIMIAVALPFCSNQLHGQPENLKEADSTPIKSPKIRQRHQGQGALNHLEVGKDCSIDEISEIESFMAIYYEIGPDNSLITFELVLSEDAIIAGFEGRNGFSPHMVLLKNNKSLAGVLPQVTKGEKDFPGYWANWGISPELDASSYVSFQLNPNQENMAFIKLPFSAAKSFYVNENRENISMSFRELQKKARASMNAE